MNKPRLPLAWALAAATVLGGCATPAPFVAAAAASPAVWRVAEHPERYLDTDVLWGGMIIEITHTERYTELEMLGFPLDGKQQPQAERADEGRYILIVGGFLDPADFAVGRFITFPGRVTGTRRGELRGQPYRWPMLDTLQPHLWPKDFRHNDTHYSIGVGVRL
jgi:outer membrane lipoprotein